MYAIITDGSISKYINHPKSLVIGDVRYPAKIFSLWTASELAAIGIIEVTFDEGNKKDEKYYINTNQTYTYDADAGTVTAAYGDATDKPHADVLFSAQDETDGLGTEGELNARGLKYNFIQTIKAQAAGILQDTDWYILRKADADTDVPSAITTFRAAVRTKAAAMETLITNASNTAAIETLYTYVNTADEGDPVVMARPLGVFPELGS
jgi:hypothetical protein